MKNNSHALPPDLCLEMLTSVLELMRRTGVEDSDIRGMFESCLTNSSERSYGKGSRSQRGLGIGNENITAEILRLWHRDDRYIDSNANPRPLPLLKGRNNLCAMIKRLNASVDATRILREMKAVKLIRRTSKGRYLPTSETAIVSSLHPLATDHIAKLVIRLVSTLSRNTDPGGTSLPLIERQAYTPDLDPTERKAFAEFTRTQGIAYLEAVDNWLEQRRMCRNTLIPQANAKGIAAGVHLFAYLEDGDIRVIRQNE